MQIILSIGIWALFLLTSCSSQPKKPVIENKSNENKKKLLVSFTIDDSVIALHDDFVVVFVSKNDTLHPLSTKNELALPVLEKDTVYSVLFKYKNYGLSFKGITKRMIFPGQNVEWKFGIDYRPFNKLKGLSSDKEYKSDIKTKELQYLQFNLLEQGDGIQFVNKISEL